MGRFCRTVLTITEKAPFMVEDLMPQFMQFVSNLLGGMGIVFGLTFVVAVADIGVSYVAKGQTLTELIQTKVVA
tara:strand:- start:525 stop:746 length:222 start_codon:yes stop_codon:yes gene_type:complete